MRARIKRGKIDRPGPALAAALERILAAEKPGLQG
jgi:hypothetical protein